MNREKFKHIIRTRYPQLYDRVGEDGMYVFVCLETIYTDKKFKNNSKNLLEVLNINPITFYSIDGTKHKVKDMRHHYMRFKFIDYLRDNKEFVALKLL